MWKIVIEFIRVSWDHYFRQCHTLARRLAAPFFLHITLQPHPLLELVPLNWFGFVISGLHIFL